MSHFVCTFQRLIQALQMGHRLPLCRGHFNNPHLQYSTCCLHRDNFGTQKTHQNDSGKEARRGRAPGASISLPHPSWQMSLFRVHLCLKVGVAAARLLQSFSGSCAGVCSLQPARSLVRHYGRGFQLQVICASFCIKQFT